MRIFFTFIILTWLLAVQAQISHSPASLKVNAPVDSSDVKLNIHLKNENDTTYEMYWKLVKDTSTWKNGWCTYICDNNFCYNCNKDNAVVANEWATGDMKLEFHFRPENIAGCTILKLILYGDKALTKELYRTTININNCFNSSKDVVVPLDIKLYPNPASEYFQISNDTKVEKIRVYNIFGREVKSFYHYNNAQHEIGELKSGLYILRLFDGKNQLIKSMKLNKVSSGA